MFRVIARLAALSMISIIGFGQTPTLSHRVFSLNKQAKDFYATIVSIEPSLKAGSDRGDIESINNLFEIDHILVADLNHLYSLVYLSESLACHEDKAIVTDLITNQRNDMSKMIDGAFGPIYVGISSTHNLKLIQVLNKFKDILKLERDLLDEIH